MSRPTRLALGLVSLIPVIGVTAGILVAADASARAVAWISVAVGVVWLIVVISWALAAPSTRPESTAGRSRLGLGGSFAQHNPPHDRDQRGR